MQNEEAVTNSTPNQTILTYNLEDLLSRSSAGNDAMLVLTTTRSSALPCRGNSTAAAARHCIAMGVPPSSVAMAVMPILTQTIYLVRI